MSTFIVGRAKLNSFVQYYIYIFINKTSVGFLLFKTLRGACIENHGPHILNISSFLCPPQKIDWPYLPPVKVLDKPLVYKNYCYHGILVSHIIFLLYDVLTVCSCTNLREFYIYTKAMTVRKMILCFLMHFRLVIKKNG